MSKISDVFHLGTGPSIDTVEGDFTQHPKENPYSRDRFSIDGGAPQTCDSAMVQPTTLITYIGGTTALASAAHTPNFL